MVHVLPGDDWRPGGLCQAGGVGGDDGLWRVVLTACWPVDRLSRPMRRAQGEQIMLVSGDGEVGNRWPYGANELGRCQALQADGR